MKLHAQNQLLMSFCFWNFKVLTVSLVMPDHAQLKSHRQCVALIDVYIQTKNPLFNSNSFWDIKVLKSCNLIYQEHFCICESDLRINLRAQLENETFTRIINVIMLYDLDQKSSTHQWADFFAKFTKPYFGGIFGHYPRFRHMKDKSVRQSHASSRNSEAIDVWKITRHPPSRRVVVCDDYSF